MLSKDQIEMINDLPFNQTVLTFNTDKDIANGAISVSILKQENNYNRELIVVEEN